MSIASPQQTPPTADGIAVEIDRLQHRMTDLHRAQSAARWTTIFLLLLILAEFAIFVFTTKRQVVANFNDADVKKAVNDRLPRLTPQVRDRLVKVAQDALPVYREQALARLKASGPAVAHDALDRLQHLPERNGQELTKRLDAGFQHVLTRLEPDIRSTFPSLSNEKKIALMHEAFNQAVQKQNAAVGDHITELYKQELARVREALDKFDIPQEIGRKNSSAREREFLHTLVDVMMDSGLKFDLGLTTPGGGADQPAPVQPQASASH